MIKLRPGDQRGGVQLDWLNSKHTFSFGSYHDPRFMGFGVLRVINDDHVEPGKGFQTHSHENMEIISYVVGGRLAHQDSEGHGSVILPGEVQLMSAGSGIRHSEINGSGDEQVHFLQIWVLPSTSGTKPRYEQHDFGRDKGLTLVVSPDGRNGSLTIGQDIDIHRAIFPATTELNIELRHTRSWIQVIHGTIEVNGETLSAGDGAALTDVTAVEITAKSAIEALIFDLA